MVWYFRNINEKYKVVDASNFEVKNISKLIFPGIGNFNNISDIFLKIKLTIKLKKLISNKIPYLGVCVGMQILLEKSDENISSKGLGIIKGKVRKINSNRINCPHNGWNNNKAKKKQNYLMT